MNPIDAAEDLPGDHGDAYRDVGWLKLIPDW
jgi:hypothetical protein